MKFISKLPEPEEIKKQYPVADKDRLIKEQRDHEIKDILSGKDQRLLLIIGPCSADNVESVLDYISRLRKLQDKVSDKLLFIPRVYTNKPRTLSIGYKGMLYSPHPQEKPNIIKGLIAIRKLLIKALSDYGFSCADEMLYPQNFSYLDDLLSYLAVGARSVENQQYRLIASGVDIPVGMKNPTNGDISIMLNGIYAAQQAQVFEYRGWECESYGNNFSHAILRGYVNKFGKSIPNYHYDDLISLSESFKKYNIKNPGVIVDTNHDNSNKRYLEQIRIAKEVLNSYHHSSEIKQLVKGLMIESYIEDGCQNINGNIYGKSITDSCLGWDKTESLVFDIAELI